MRARVTALHQAIVLTAGRGTRLWPLTAVRAKPAIPVAGEPMICRIIKWLVAEGVTDLVLNLHHLPETLTALIGDGGDLSASVRYSWEPVVLGSAGGPRQAAPILAADEFLLVNGDTLTDLKVSGLAAAHRASDALVTLALVPNREPHRYGGVRIEAEGVVTGFVARGPAAEGSYHFIGVQLASSDAFRSVAPGEPVNSIGGVYDDLIATERGSVRGFVCDARFWDVGTPADYLSTSEAFGGGGVGRRARIDPSACLTGSILWDDVEIGPACRLERCIVTDRVRVPAGSTHRHEILLAEPNGDVFAAPLPGVG
jgi:NDP-sugar pyrophosphorylase family protein